MDIICRTCKFHENIANFWLFKGEIAYLWKNACLLLSQYVGFCH
nr:MAG TPA: RNA polymerase subunit [Caudoviricetes sp.]